MQMDHIAAAGLFMQVIDILCNDMNVKVLFQFSQSDMSCVGLGVEQFPASLVVEVEDQFRVSFCNLFNKYQNVLSKYDLNGEALLKLFTRASLYIP